MEKYLKDRKGRKLSLDQINHYLKIAKAIRLPWLPNAGAPVYRKQAKEELPHISLALRYVIGGSPLVSIRIP